MCTSCTNNSRIESKTKNASQSDKVAFNSKKLLFLIPIFIGIGLLFAAGIGGTGLFAQNPPPWLTNIVAAIRNVGTDKMLWAMMIGGGLIGLTSIGCGFFGMARKSLPKELTFDEKVTRALPNESYAYTYDPESESYTFYAKDKNGNILPTQTNLTIDQVIHETYNLGDRYGVISITHLKIADL